MTYTPPEAQDVQYDVARWHTERHKKRQNRCEVDEQKESESEAESTTVALTGGGTPQAQAILHHEKSGGQRLDKPENIDLVGLEDIGETEYQRRRIEENQQNRQPLYAVADTIVWWRDFKDVINRRFQRERWSHVGLIIVLTLRATPVRLSRSRGLHALSPDRPCLDTDTGDRAMRAGESSPGGCS